MDRRVFLALSVLAAAAGSPAFAEQVRVAGEKGSMLHLHPRALVRSIYRVALSRNGQSVGTKCLVKLGHNRSEAAQMATLTISIARKCGSLENFLKLGSGKPLPDVRLDSREMALLRRVGVGGAAAAGTWEGSSGRTWEGSAMVAGKPVGPAAIWDGRTWEGSAM